MLELPLDEGSGRLIVALEDISSFEPAPESGTLITLRGGRSFRTSADPLAVRAAVLELRSGFVTLRTAEALSTH